MHIFREFYTGWLTHWGEDNAKTGANFTVAALEVILSRNRFAVLYVFRFFYCSQVIIYLILTWCAFLEFLDGIWLNKLWVLYWCKYWCKWVRVRAWSYILWLRKNEMAFSCNFLQNITPLIKLTSFSSRMHLLESPVTSTMQSSKVYY